MTLKQLKLRTNVIRGKGYCEYIVTITYRGKDYRCRSNNSLAWDRLDDYDHRDNEVVGFYTNKGAYEAFYEECLRANALGKYKNDFTYMRYHR